MSKPILTFGGFAPLLIHQYERYLPTAFDESMTILQKVNKVIMYLNQIGEATDNVVAQWNEVMEWILAEGVRDTIIAKLDNMILDGTLATIINEEIFAELNADIQAVEESLLSEIDKITALREDVDTHEERLKKFDGLTTQTVDLYVSNSGVDSPLSGSINSPYKTLQYVADSIPKLINHDRFIWVEDGIYDEDVQFKSISGGAIVIGRKDGIIPSTSSTGLKVRSIEFLDCTGLCRVNNFEEYNSQNMTDDAFVRFSRCGYATAHALRCANTTITKTTIEFDGTNGSVNSSFFDGQQICVHSKNGSSVRVDSTNTHGATPSATGILSEAGQVFLNGANEWVEGANNSIAQSMGGLINYTPIQKDLTLENGWVNYDETLNKPRAIKHNGVVYLQGIIQNGSVGVGINAFVLPPLWRPQFNNRAYHPFSSDGQATKVYIKTNGEVSVEVHTGQYISLSDIPPFYVGE